MLLGGLLLRFGISLSCLALTPAGFQSTYHVGYCWYSGWASVLPALYQTVNMTQLHECSEEFDLDMDDCGPRYIAAMDEVIALAEAASRLQVAMITTVNRACHSPHVLRAARSGVAVFLQQGQNPAVFPDDSNQSEIVTSEDSLLLHFRYDMDAGARFLGKEFCRKAGARPQKLALFIPPGDHMNRSIRMTYDVLKTECPQAQVTLAKVITTDSFVRPAARELWKGIFTADASLTGVIVNHDGLGAMVIEAADEVLSASQARALLVTGQWNQREAAKMVEDRRLLATTDLLNEVAPSEVGPDGFGFWKTFQKIYRIADSMDFPSTMAIRTGMGLEWNEINTPFIEKSTDPEGYLVQQLLSSYERSARARQQEPTSATRVEARLVELDIGDFDLRGHVECSFWLQLSWWDMRLTWFDRQFNGTLRWDSDSVWTPAIVLVNLESGGVLHTSALRISHDGSIRQEIHYQGSFSCAMDNGPHPFVINECSIRISTSADTEDVELVPVEMRTIGGPQGFRLPEVVGYGTVYNAYSAISGRVEAIFTYRAIRQTSFIVWTYVFGAWLLNLMSFSQLYIPALDDRTGLALTTVLAAMVLQMQARVSAVTTWLDLFLSVSLIFQFSAFLVSVIARRSARKYVEDDFSIKAEWHVECEAPLWERMMMVMVGTQHNVTEDRWSRRLQVPIYCVIVMSLTFCNIGSLDITQHPEHGFRCPLFWFGLLNFMPYIVCLGLYPTWSRRHRVRVLAFSAVHQAMTQAVDAAHQAVDVAASMKEQVQEQVVNAPSGLGASFPFQRRSPDGQARQTSQTTSGVTERDV